MLLKEKVCLVTGAGAGLGRAIVERLSAEGGLIAACDIDPERLSTLSEDNPRVVTTTVLDVSDPAAMANWIGQTHAFFGRIDVLINNAGIMDHDDGVAELDLDLWRKVMAVNLDGPMLAMRHAIPIMLTQGRGSVVNIASSAGLRGGAAGAAYTSSKHALVGLTKSTAWHYGPSGIRCNALAPGGMSTELAKKFENLAETPATKRLSSVRSSIPASVETSQVASATAWLASDQALGINGVILAVDEGWLAG